MSEEAIWVSVIIVCHNDGKWLPRCLDSVRAQTIFDRIELIIADNASGDGSDKLAQSLIAGWPNARFLPTGGDNGFGVACNLAAEAAGGRYLYLINPDTRLERDCVERLYEVAERTRAGALGGTVLDYEEDSIQAEGGTGFDFCGNPVVTTGKYRPEFLMCPGTFFFIRKDLFMRIGMMDRKFFMYGEEMDLSWRIWIAGEEIRSALVSRIHHRGAVGVDPSGATTAIENRTSVQKRFLANRNRLLTIAKCHQHVLLLMLIPCTMLILVEALATWIMARSWSLARATCFDAITDFWRLRGHIFEQRRQIAAFRRRGDFWLLRFFRFKFGRWEEIRKVMERGFPRFG